MEQFSRMLAGHPYFHLNTDGDLFHLNTVAVDDRTHVIMGSLPVIQAIADGRELELHMDSAVKTVPGLFQQLLAIQAVSGDNVS